MSINTEKIRMKIFLTRLALFNFVLLIYLSLSAQTLSFDTDIEYKKNQDTVFTELKLGQTIKLVPGDFVFAETKDNLPILILAAKSDKTSIKVTNADIRRYFLKKLSEQVNADVSEIIEVIRKSEILMQKREYTQAINILNPAREKFPNNSEVLFLSGTLNYLLNNKNLAKDELEKGLAINPKNTAAQKLLESIKRSSP